MKIKTLTQNEINQLIDWCVWVGYCAGLHKEGNQTKEAQAIKSDIAKSEHLPAYILGQQ